MKVGAWTWVLLGGIFETAWAVTMKYSEGFTQIFWTAATLAFLGCSIYLLNGGMKRGVPVGGGYAVWVGIGAVGSIIMGLILFAEPLDSTRLAFAALIIVGIIGVELTCNPTKQECNQKPQLTKRNSEML
ncbi:MAG: DMT family transporter [Methanocella sp.]|jgi:quaternary ammonium compound-resistance protein SugE